MKRFLLAFAVVAPIVLAIELAKGAPPFTAATFAVLWGAILAVVLAVAGYMRDRYRRHAARRRRGDRT